MAVSITLETKVEQRDDGWVVTTSVNGILGPITHGPFPNKDLAAIAAKALLQSLTEDLERARSGASLHLPTRLQ